MTWGKIYLHLKEYGVDVYSLGQHEGMCISPYLVLRDNGKIRKKSVEVTEFELLLYYPTAQYSEFSAYIDRIKEVMNVLYPALTLIDDEQPHYLDDQVGAYMTSLIYRGAKVSKVNRI